MLDPVGQLSAAQLALYLVLILPLVYIAIKHGRPGISGRSFLFLFCSLHIIGSGLQISNEKPGTTSTSAQIINGIGLFPLILVFGEILHESYVPLLSILTPYLHS